MKKIFSLIAAALMMSAMVANAEVKSAMETEFDANSNMTTIIKNKHHIKATYAKDDQGRVVRKTLFMSVRGHWMPFGEYTAHFGDDENTLVFARWSNQTKSFTSNIEQVSFDSQEYPILLNLPVEE